VRCPAWVTSFLDAAADDIEQITHQPVHLSR
jgi:hypothetical protein